MPEHALSLALHFTRRELRSRYLGSFSGGFWALLQPLIQLAVYGFVFVYVFKTRLPGADAVGFVPFLVMALWPWVAFSESILRANTVIQENAGLIGKVALPREILVIASLASSFIVHITGFIVISLVLALSGVAIQIQWLPVALLAYMQLFMLSLGIGFIFAAIQVFVRDLAQALAQIITLWMFASPIFYTRDMLPVAYRGLLDFNPFAPYAELFRYLLLGAGSFSWATQITSLLLAIAMLLVGWWIFRRLDPHFEDFL